MKRTDTDCARTEQRARLDALHTANQETMAPQGLEHYGSAARAREVQAAMQALKEVRETACSSELRVMPSEG